jgi:outer membrane protein OmpA-like peptidoglycan-associated protein
MAPSASGLDAVSRNNLYVSGDIPEPEGRIDGRIHRALMLARPNFVGARMAASRLRDMEGTKKMIRKMLIGLTAILFVVSCTTMDQVTGERTPNRTANGAILGALGGAALGTLAGGDDRRNALIGAGVGALAGAAIGNYMDRQYQNLRQRLAGTGVGVERVSENQIKLNFPADLTFDFNRDSVKSGFVPTLSNVASVLSQYPQTTIDVYGFADSVGSDSYNQDLSERRAMNVASVLSQNGVIRQRIAATGFGESRPVASNETDSGRAQNRRVEVFISAFQG